MGKSLGDYNKERSSSSDINNIKWTQKNPTDSDKSKNKKPTKSTSHSNIIYTKKSQTQVLPIKKIFKIENSKTDKLKNKKKTLEKKFQTSSTSNCNIEPSFSRKAR